MQSILRWSLENSSPMDSAAGDAPPIDQKKLDPAIIDLILGKPDSEQMKEDMAVAVDASKTEDERIEALDHMEMLIEQIDNANNLEVLKLWEPLHSLLTADSSTIEIKTQALWVIGTALQNNPSAQDDYIVYNPLPTILSFLEPSPSSTPAIRAKAIYTLSGMLKHNGPAVRALDPSGWTQLRDALQDPSIAARRKVVFLLSSLLMPNVPTTSEPAPPSALRIADNPNASTPAPTTGNVLTPDNRPAESSSDPIFANSHASHLRNPNRSNTSQPTLVAFREHGLLDAVISAITNPVPYGDDGENTASDTDFEEKSMHLLYTYAVTCQEELSKTQKETLKTWIQSEKAKKGEPDLLERWNLSRQEYAALVGKLL